MGDSPNILITTSSKPSEHSRSFCFTLSKVIPNSVYFTRGNTNTEMLHKIALENEIKYIIFVFSKGNEVSKVKIYESTKNSLIKQKEELRILEFIDYQVFGWKYIPVEGPLSTTLEARRNYPDLYDFFEKYFSLEYKIKTSIWLMIDIKENSCYVQFIDSLSLRKILFAEVQLLNSEINGE